MKKVTLFIALATLLWNCATDHLQPSQDAYQLDEEKSVALWKGRLRTGYSEEGVITVKSDQLVIENGTVVGGSFSLPVSSILSTSLPDSLKPVLVHHLQSADFFDMALHPTITYAITSVEPYSGSEGLAGSNVRVTGNLTILGKSNPVRFPAKMQVSHNQLTVEATLQIDRTQWGMLYSADPTLPDEKYILPAIDIHLKLVGNKQ
ncbi:YceI family protein [Larkinella bovis]|uniref:YceI family protein n=1 Tax=Larkinella bovis TaxID=683041 RepID=A0ABW0IDF7_9BACT